jgi:ABC-type arginine transport system ATPase subunit
MHCTGPPSLETIVFHFTKAQFVIILLLSLFVSLAHVSLFSHLHYLLHSPPGSPVYIGGNFFNLPKQERTRKKKVKRGILSVGIICQSTQLFPDLSITKKKHSIVKNFNVKKILRG